VDGAARAWPGRLHGSGVARICLSRIVFHAVPKSRKLKLEKAFGPRVRARIQSHFPCNYFHLPLVT